MIRSCTAFICTAAMALFAAAAANAQTAATAAADVRTNTALPAYDVTKEVKVQGTIQKIDSSGTNGLIGTQIMIQTASGVVDAHLGYGPAKASSLGISEGQSVTVVGMMQSVGNSNVLLARILTTSSHVFVLRNEHGIPVRALPRSNGHSAPVFNSQLRQSQVSSHGRPVNA
jgi:hypothetical protein